MDPGYQEKEIPGQNYSRTNISNNNSRKNNWHNNRGKLSEIIRNKNRRNINLRNQSYQTITITRKKTHTQKKKENKIPQPEEFEVNPNLKTCINCSNSKIKIKKLYPTQPRQKRKCYLFTPIRQITTALSTISTTKIDTSTIPPKPSLPKQSPLQRK